ncbi:MAG: hypothetical protein VB119_01435 [Candidatus Metalachnospira sp.]|nr:hypothetical protein [Candidatus Metalachnospira sp.]
MKIDFVKISPTENITILVKSPVTKENQLYVGTELIKYSSVYAEQVGFIEKPLSSNVVSRLQMMAGEFCGNGTMALAAYKVFEQGLNSGNEIDVPLEVSGADDALMCHIKVLEQGKYVGTVNMPLPLVIKEDNYIICGREMTLPTVVFEGIKHIILPKEYIGDNFRNVLETSIESLNNQIDCDAFGIIVFDEEKNYINPLVSIKSAGSLYWERGCGSGSEAIGVYLAHRYKKSIECDISQPGGTITVKVEYRDKIVSASITGNVIIVAEGTAYIYDFNRL